MATFDPILGRLTGADAVASSAVIAHDQDPNAHADIPQQFRQGTPEECDSIVPVAGEPLWDGATLRVGNGYSAGGVRISEPEPYCPHGSILLSAVRIGGFDGSKPIIPTMPNYPKTWLTDNNDYWHMVVYHTTGGTFSGYIPLVVQMHPSSSGDKADSTSPFYIDFRQITNLTTADPGYLVYPGGACTLVVHGNGDRPLAIYADHSNSSILAGPILRVIPPGSVIFGAYTPGGPNPLTHLATLADDFHFSCDNSSAWYGAAMTIVADGVLTHVNIDDLLRLSTIGKYYYVQLQGSVGGNGKLRYTDFICGNEHTNMIIMVGEDLYLQNKVVIDTETLEGPFNTCIIYSTDLTFSSRLKKIKFNSIASGDMFVLIAALPDRSNQDAGEIRGLTPADPSFANYVVALNAKNWNVVMGEDD